MGPKRRPPTIDNVPPESSCQSFRVTDSGTFHKGDFRINAAGISQAPGGGAAGDEHAASTLTLNDLELGRTLGKGASGEVKLAINKLTGDQIALKCVNVFDEGRRQQLLPELLALLGEQHPSLVRFYDAFFDKGHIYVALEYMDAGSVDHLLLDRKKVPEEVVGAMMQQALSGLNFLHVERSQVHRDMKPDNLLVNQKGQVKIADFGISKKISDTKAAAATFVGTAIYMSPERIESGSHSFPSDIWSLGVIAVECVMGTHPYKKAATKYFELLTAVLQGPEPMPEGDFSPEFMDFVSRCVVKDAKTRASAEELLAHPFIMKHAANAQDTVRLWLAAGAKESAVPVILEEGAADLAK